MRLIIVRFSYRICKNSRLSADPLPPLTVKWYKNLITMAPKIQPRSWNLFYDNFNKNWFHCNISPYDLLDSFLYFQGVLEDLTVHLVRTTSLPERRVRSEKLESKETQEKMGRREEVDRVRRGNPTSTEDQMDFLDLLEWRVNLFWFLAHQKLFMVDMCLFDTSK